MGFKGQPGPNFYKLPTTVGLRNHDPTRTQGPVYTIRKKLQENRTGLGPGLYRLSEKTRFGNCTAPGITIGAKLRDPYHFISPGPQHYKPEKVYHAKQNPPKFTIGQRTPLPKPQYVPSADSYKLPSALGPGVPDKPCNAAITIGKKLKTPRVGGNPAPDRYGPVRADCYKPAAPVFTMRSKVFGAQDKTQKPAPNRYWPKLKHKATRPSISFGRRDPDSRLLMFTLEDIQV